MKSASLVATDVGSIVYLWLVDGETERSALHGVSTLEAFEAITIPQERDPSKRKDAFRLTLSQAVTEILAPLSMDDLTPYRFVEGGDGLESLGRIHRDRNDKIIRLAPGEAGALAARFRN